MQQQTDEWHEWRRNHIGASDAPVIMEVSPWKSPYELWKEKLGFGEQRSTVAMRRGLAMEQEAREAYETEVGVSVKPEVVTHKDFSWMGASLDGLSADKSLAVEIKCPGKEDHAIACSGKVPEKYWPQVQHQLACLDINLLHYFSYTLEGFAIVEVRRDQDYIETLYEKEKDFWRRVQTFEAPELGKKDWSTVEDEGWCRTADEWLRVNRELKVLQEVERGCRERLVNMAAGRNVHGGNVKVSQVVRRGNVDYSKIPELKGLDLDPYRKSNTKYWRISESS